MSLFQNRLKDRNYRKNIKENEDEEKQTALQSLDLKQEETTLKSINIYIRWIRTASDSPTYGPEGYKFNCHLGITWKYSSRIPCMFYQAWQDELVLRWDKQPLNRGTDSSVLLKWHIKILIFHHRSGVQRREDPNVNMQLLHISPPCTDA